MGLGVALRPLPARAATVLGAALGRIARRFYVNVPFVERMKAVAGRLDPTLANDPRAQDAFVRRWFANTGRTMVEFSKIVEIAEGIDVGGLKHVAAARASGRSVVLVTVHVGLWELVSYLVAKHFEVEGTGAWAPQPNRFENRLLAANRRRFGTRILPASPHLAARLYRVLRVPGQLIVLVIDEPSERAIKFPLFGRPFTERSNASFAIRSAQKADAVLMPILIARTPQMGMRYEYQPHFEVARSREGLEAAAQALNAIFEPHVNAHLDQWYMLHKLKL